LQKLIKYLPRISIDRYKSIKVVNGPLLILDMKVNDEEFKSTTLGMIIASDENA